MDIQLTIYHMQLHEGLQLPHNMMPGSYIGGSDHDFDEARWTAYQWNPPGGLEGDPDLATHPKHCLLYTSPSPRDRQKSRMPSSA